MRQIKLQRHMGAEASELNLVVTGRVVTKEQVPFVETEIKAARSVLQKLQEDRHRNFVSLGNIKCEDVVITVYGS